MSTDFNEDSQLPFFSVEDPDLEIPLNSNSVKRRQFTPITLGNVIARWTMMTLRESGQRAKRPGFGSFPLKFLPPEIIYQIFEHVHPIDLYNAARTSRALRGMLFSRYGKTIWKTALLAQLPSVPSKPSELLEHEWIILLYRPDECDSCRNKGAVFHCAFRQWLCKACEENQFVFKVENAPGIESLATIVKQRIPYTALYVNGVGYKRYRLSDIACMISRVKEYLSAIESKKPCADVIYKEFLNSERIRILEIKEHADNYKLWFERIFRLLKEHINLLYNKTSVTFLKDLALLDYDERDLLSAKPRIDWFIRESYILRPSRRNWKKILPQLDLIVKIETFIRLERERMKIVVVLFNEYLKSMPAETWSPAPQPTQILQFEFFHQYIHSTDLTLEILRSEIANEAFDDALECWRKRTQRELAMLVGSHNKDISETDIVNVVDLATSVFICKYRHCVGECKGRRPCTLFGWKDAGAHNHTDQPWPIIFSRIGFEAAASIVCLLGLDPERTRVSELDKLDARLFCENCTSRKDGKLKRLKSQKAFTWRECVIHSIEMAADTSHKRNRWALLTPDATVSVRACENPIHPPDSLSWSCNHCPIHYRKFTRRIDVTMHVRDGHSILHPVPGRDIIFMARPNLPRVALSLERDVNKICKHCSPTKNRLRLLQGMCSHLSDKHGVRQPVENLDWVSVKIVEKTTSGDI